jgi:hypothetical protein
MKGLRVDVIIALCANPSKILGCYDAHFGKKNSVHFATFSTRDAVSLLEFNSNFKYEVLDISMIS